MSASSTGIPPLIERQLLALDKQLRDAAFVRGFGRTVCGVCLLLGACLLFDGLLDLSGSLRMALLIGWIAAACGLLWRYLIRPALQPTSFSTLAALVEQQFPELRERLTSLVELRSEEQADLAPGASKLMQDLLARQTVKALDQLSGDPIGWSPASSRAAFAGVIAILLLLAPFGWMSGGYGLLWSRFFVPWGNYSWGSTLEMKVVEGNQIIARGSDATVHVSVTSRRGRRDADLIPQSTVWLNWSDTQGSSDSRRLEWDESSQQFVATLPHVRQSLTFQVTTDGAKTGTYRIDVSDPPAITQMTMDIEPAAYTGLPARSLAGVPSEIRVPEFTRIRIAVELSEAVSSAELIWPAAAGIAPTSSGRSDHGAMTERSFPLDLSDDRRSGSVQVIARLTGEFAVRAKNEFGLQNNDAMRTVEVVADQLPQIQCAGSDEPKLARPDDLIEIPVEAGDDFGLSIVELHAETSTGSKEILTVPDELRRQSQFAYTFVLDLSSLELNDGQVVTYRVRAVDNRPEPNPQEVWTASRALMINTSLKQLPDQQLAGEEKSLEEELTSLRSELSETKAELAKLHQRTEQEALEQQPEADKTERLDELKQAQENLMERIEKLTDRLAERRMTRVLASKAEQIAENELNTVQDRLEEAKGQKSRDQLAPLAEALDQLGSVDRQLNQLEQQLNELNKLEQDLAELTRMAQRAERLAEQLDKLDAQQQEAGSKEQSTDAMAPTDKDTLTNPANQSVTKKDDTGATSTSRDNASRPEVPSAEMEKTTVPEASATTSTTKDSQSGELQRMKDAGQKLTNQMKELWNKHPELLETARRDQQDQLNSLAEQAENLAGSQERLAQALEQAANEAPAVASRPENRKEPSSESQSPFQSASGGADSRAAASEDGEKSSSAAEKTPQRSSGANENPSTSPPTAVPGNSNEPDAKTASSRPAAQPAGPAMQPTPQQTGREVARQQEQLARESAEQALQLARETGADSDVTRAAADFARQADAAKQQTQSGQLNEAAKSARAAAKAAEESSRQLNPDGSVDSPPSRQAKMLADKQNQVARQLEQLAESPEASQGAQQQGQHRLAEATSQLAEQMGRVAKTLKSEPLNSPQEGESGEQSQQMMKQAERSMTQAEEANRQQDLRQSAAAARDATQMLRQAAQVAKASRSTKSDSLPVPKEIGTKMAQATKQLEAAQEELSQCNCDQPGSGRSGSRTGQPAPGQSPSSQATSVQPSPAGQGQPSPAVQSQSATASGSKPAGTSSEPDGEATSSKGTGQPEIANGSARPSGSKNNLPTSGSSQMSQTAERFRDVAALLKQVRGEQAASSSSQAKNSRGLGKLKSDPTKSDSFPIPSDASEGGADGSGVDMPADLSHLDAELQQQARHNWGRLPGQLRTEILQGAGKKSHPEYTQRIKSYFDEITKPAK